MSKIEKEKRVISLMIKIYCKKKHAHTFLCEECVGLENYAHQRLNACRYGEKKGFCTHCPTQCYAKQQKEHIRNVMRFSGPRMLFHHPILLFKHIFFS
ncbi:MAG: nitrous oxide-stimulated promoter family protein [Spirochaetia bacterium]